MHKALIKAAHPSLSIGHESYIAYGLAAFRRLPQEELLGSRTSRAPRLLRLNGKRTTGVNGNVLGSTFQ
jgi:hypothetical protein